MILQKNEVTVGKNSSTSYLFDDKGIMKSETKVTSQKRVLKESPTTPPSPFGTRNTVYFIHVMAIVKKKITANLKKSLYNITSSHMFKTLLNELLG